MKKIAAERRDSDPAFAKFQGLDIKISKVRKYRLQFLAVNLNGFESCF
jgi:hypothetical protein